jgi:hypothetical protein
MQATSTNIVVASVYERLGVIKETILFTTTGMALRKNIGGDMAKQDPKRLLRRLLIGKRTPQRSDISWPTVL